MSQGNAIELLLRGKALMTRLEAENASLRADNERLRAALRGANRYLPYWRPRTELARQVKLETLAMIRAALVKDPQDG